jgi:hypothetical protein
MHVNQSVYALVDGSYLGCMRTSNSKDVYAKTRMLRAFLKEMNITSRPFTNNLMGPHQQVHLPLLRAVAEKACLGENCAYHRWAQVLGYPEKLRTLNPIAVSAVDRANA